MREYKQETHPFDIPRAWVRLAKSYLYRFLRIQGTTKRATGHDTSVDGLFVLAGFVS